MRANLRAWANLVERCTARSPLLALWLLRLLLSMAADDASDLELRVARRARSACSWATTVFAIEDRIADSRYPVGSTERQTMHLLGIVGEDAGDDLHDLATWSRLQRHVRDELQLSSDVDFVRNSHRSGSIVPDLYASGACGSHPAIAVRFFFIDFRTVRYT